MVTFICGSCNATLKKSQVASHLNRCGRNVGLSCLDCGVEFDCYSYVQHTSCITEAQKVEGTLWRGGKKKAADAGGSAGSGKKDSWTSIISEAISREAELASADDKRCLRKLEGLENVPNKQKKFCNFVKNSLGERKGGDEVWNFLLLVKGDREKKREEEENEKEKEKAALSKATEEETKARANSEREKKSGKNNEAEEEEEKEEEGDGKGEAKNSSDSKGALDSSVRRKAVKMIKKMLKKEPDRSLKLKAIRKEFTSGSVVLGKRQLKAVVEEEEIFVLNGKLCKLIKASGKSSS